MPDARILESRARRVLLVDDESIVRRATEKLLAVLGYRVEPVDSGEVALERFTAARDTGQPFDAVILDLTMPGGMDGRECLKRLRRLDAAVPVILSSGYADRPEVAEPLALGFSAVLVKPYLLETLRVTLERLLPDAPADPPGPPPAADPA